MAVRISNSSEPRLYPSTNATDSESEGNVVGEHPKKSDLKTSLPDPNAVVDNIVAADEDFNEDNPKGPISGIEPQDLKNYVTNDAIRNSVISDVLVYIKVARDNREAKIEQDWVRYRDIYNLRRLVAYYEGRSRLFIPAVKKAIDVLTRVAKDAIFSDPYLGIETNIPKYKDAAMDLMLWLLEDQGHIREKTAIFLRQLYMIGTSCFKLSWIKRKRKIKYREYDKDIGQSVIKARDEFDHYGPKIDVVDMQHIYVWPETAIDYDSLRIVFEDSTIRVSEL